MYQFICYSNIFINDFFYVLA